MRNNPCGSVAGSGISMPPYYRPTPSIKNRNNFFPQTEQIEAGEMRITFMGSNPFPPRFNQAGTSFMRVCAPAYPHTELLRVQVGTKVTQSRVYH